MPLEEILIANPSRRKRRHRKHGKRHRRLANPHRFHMKRHGGRSRRRLTNPRFTARGVVSTITPAVIGAGGAMLLDVGMAYLPLPTALQSGWGKVAAQVGGALALGFLAGKVRFIGHRNAALFTGGALTIIAYNALRPMIAQAIGDKVKGLSGLADFGDYRGMGAYINPAPVLQGSSGVGAYLPSGGALRTRMGAYYPGMGGTYSEDMFGS